MNIDELQQALGEAQFASLKGYVEDLVGQRDAARRESVDGRKGLRARVESLEALRQRLLEKFGVDSEEEIEALAEARGPVGAARSLEVRSRRLEAELKRVAAERDELSNRHRQLVQSQALERAISQHPFADTETVQWIVERALRWEGDALMYQARDGQIVPLEEGLAMLARDKPALLKTSPAAGSGFGTGAMAGAAQANPWARGSENLTEQGRLVRENPSLAAQMKSAASIK